MKINRNTQVSTIKPKITSEDISKETMKDFPDLTGHDMYNGPACGSTFGYEMPVNDQVYIGKRSKELEAELTAIPKKMKKLQMCTNVAAGVYLAGALSFTAALGGVALTAIGAPIPGSVLMGMIGAGGSALLAGAIVGDSSESAMHKDWIKYYDDRTELDHLRRGELWNPGPSYIAPDPANDCGVPHSPVEKDGVVYY